MQHDAKMLGTSSRSFVRNLSDHSRINLDCICKHPLYVIWLHNHVIMVKKQLIYLSKNKNVHCFALFTTEEKNESFLL